MQKQAQQDSASASLDRLVRSIVPPNSDRMRLDPLDGIYDFLRRNEQRSNDILDVAMHLASLRAGQNGDYGSLVADCWELSYSSNAQVMALSALADFAQHVSERSSSSATTTIFHSTLTWHALTIGVVAEHTRAHVLPLQARSATECAGSCQPKRAYDQLRVRIHARARALPFLFTHTCLSANTSTTYTHTYARTHTSIHPSRYVE